MTDQDPPPPPPVAAVPDAPSAGGGTAGPHPVPARRRHGRWWVTGWTVFVVLALAVAVASRWNLNYYALQPGQAQSVQPFITVPADRAHPVVDPVLLTDVEEGRVTALSYLYFKLSSHTALYPLEAVTGGTDPGQLLAQGQLEMSQAETAAKVAALRRLGYPVPGRPVGAVIAGTFPGTPASSTLFVGDVVTAVDGVATPTAEALDTRLRDFHSGESVTFSVRRQGRGPVVTVPVTLRRTLVDVGLAHPVPLLLGIEPEDQVAYTYPFPVSIAVQDIGGPSAGLAMTLGLLDTLTGGHLTGGHTVAATGTMDAQGDVGPVGGVPQKTIAVENAGATIFLVPPAEYRDAKSEDRPGLAIYPVSTLGQALAVLAAHGGGLPKGSHATVAPG